MARYAGTSVLEIAEIAYRYPFLWFQLCHDMKLAQQEEEQEKLGGSGGWRKPGETIAEAHKRLKEGRERAKREIEEKLRQK